MAFTKYASLEAAEVLEVKGSANRVQSASLTKIAEFDDYRTKDGYLYARIRAISSRVNKNHDGWPSIQLAGGDEAWERISANRQSSEGFTVEADTDQEYGFPTFLGKPIFVDHHNSNPKKARGVIVDSKFKVLDQKTASSDNYWGSDNASPEHLPPVEVELLLEVDAKTFPHLAKAIVDGDIDGFSMGCDVNMSKCSVCDNEARSPSDYCLHVKQKGAEFDHYSADGTKTSKKAYEDCYGIKFFEISAVFDPADETALAREIISKIQHEADQFDNGAEVYRTQGPSQHVPLKIEMIDQLPDGTQAYLVNGLWYNDNELSSFPDVEHAVRALDPDNLTPEMFEHPDNLADNEPGTLMPPAPNQWPRAAKVADAPLPQSEMTKAPQAVDTLRENKICPVCGSDIEGTKCDICQYVPPPDGLDNPDLSKARGQDHPEGFELEEDSSPNVPGDPLAEKPAPGDATATSYLRARNSARTARVTGEMPWEPEITPRLAAALEADAKPSEEPAEEVVTNDEDAPTTAATQKEGEASATPADPSAKPDKQVSVTDVGGVIDATNEEASKPDVSTQVDGTGGITDASNEQASKPDERQDVSATDSDNAGFNKDKTTDDSGPTKTFPKGNKDIDAGSPHDNSAFTGAAVEAAKTGPAKPPKTPGLDVDADARVDVENSDGFNNPGTDTDQWTGTGGNGVTRQQDPVTKQVGPGNDVRSSSVFRALKLADTEVKLGLTTEDDKYNRIAELADLSDDEFKAAATVVARVKTAGLAKRQARTAHALPNLQSKPGDETVTKEAASEVPDEAIFFSSLL